MQNIKVLVVENKEPVRKGLVSILKEFKFIGEARGINDAESLFFLLTSWMPDIILMDLEMPDINGLEAVRKILHTYKHIRVIGLSFQEEEKFILDMIGMGAHGFLLKDSDPVEIEKAISAAYVKDFYLSEYLAKVMRRSIKGTVPVSAVS